MVIKKVFGVITSGGGVMPSFVFPKVHRLNTEAYILCFEEVGLSWVKRKAVGRVYEMRRRCHVLTVAV